MSASSFPASSTLAIVLAAGLGTRMKSNRPKVMHEVGGLPLVGHVLKAVEAADVGRAAVVIGPDMDDLAKLVGDISSSATCHVQEERLGTAHAVRAAEAAYRDTPDHVLVLLGDAPLVSPETIRRVKTRLEDGVDIVVLGFEAADPFGYGRLVKEGDRLVAIREERDASNPEKAITLCNSGIMAFRGEHFSDLVNAIGNDNAKGEYYLTDAIEIAHARGLRLETETAPEWEVQGINTRGQLAAVEAVFQKLCREQAMASGVSLIAPETVFFSHDTRLAPDVTVEPNVVFATGVTVESGARIRAFSHLEGAHVARGATVGPYARLRPGARIGETAHIGNFVEIKNATIETGAKVNHLSYIGDARVGAKANVGAGTITCNYDGFLKHHTDIGAGAFIGSNATLVAPVSIGDGAYTAAGSVITKDVAADALALGRARQSEKPGRAAEIRARLAKEKQARQKG
ncbi:bifunctional UDP-N-acetylglucosamine diphosphorylase/glucosamine-1-phosphate N-acetyltransferase GlmU [Rhizobiales bacterium]|uniref:bifunctional UDP-N-acetylglucosamine diphosphorylase/glucosamine-1-phosphate N-acetyltransferase GlmU n=1 Tax=Hongsoonwoonella zoysiae TaxID=2821844 RepID=UPI00155F9D26|nr:bifunctional UDP-N-acetylglucosamine diphosphorylase/glucosamine-1-phosphate N-acetyltransferase GlmU [Hongsoonwoonella zoysiae]NRG18562.1 bifunctional UDP-N-acetylglucosamine diphosphorylase/glucosamine-1-phosphate N-acetyltransferase GlmU [Hongsoonwoonella zoysiae]